MANPILTSSSGVATDIRLAPATKPGDLGMLGHYRVLRLLGQGGMGVVYYGWDDALDRPVALKVMQAKFANKPVARERFVTEARSVAQLRNEHVITIYHVGEGNGQPFMALEYLKGESLEHFLRTRPAPNLPRLLRIAGRSPPDWPPPTRPT
jgi:eukaryotic-like serine/threonine-protein kinase